MQLPGLCIWRLACAAAGVLLATVLTVLAFSLFVAAVVSGAMASGALMCEPAY